MTSSGPWTPGQRQSGGTDPQPGGLPYDGTPVGGQPFGGAPRAAQPYPRQAPGAPTQFGPQFGAPPASGQPFPGQQFGAGPQGEEPKKKPGWLTWVLIGVAVLFLIGMCSVAVGGGEEDSTAGSAVTSEEVVPEAVNPESAAIAEEPAAAPAPQVEVAPQPEPEPATEQVPREFQNAVRSAEMYLRTMPFSKQGLAEQLEFEDYSPEAARYAVDSLGADWNAQAVAAGENYLEIMGFSEQGLIDQLVFDGFTQSEARYAADQLF